MQPRLSLIGLLNINEGDIQFDICHLMSFRYVLVVVIYSNGLPATFAIFRFNSLSPTSFCFVHSNLTRQYQGALHFAQEDSIIASCALYGFWRGGVPGYSSSSEQSPYAVCRQSVCYIVMCNVRLRSNTHQGSSSSLPSMPSLPFLFTKLYRRSVSTSVDRIHESR